jgi:acetoacetate decarboxylase
VQPRKSIHPIIRVLVVCLSGVALAIAACLCLVGCGSDEKKVEQPTTVPATAMPQATTTPKPVATQRPYSFLGTRRLMTATVPTNLELYRSLLPAKFDMPDQPLMVVAAAHYYDVTLPLVPYHEGYVLLRCKYQGTTGFYTYTMPVDDKTANDGGRAIGFNKYVADKITLEEENGVWIGRVVYGGKTVMEITFTPKGSPTKDNSQDNSVLFNLVPPGQGPQVFEINSSPSGDQTLVTTQGSATVKGDASEPWAGLLNPDGSTAWAVFQELKGDSILTWEVRE